MTHDSNVPYIGRATSRVDGPLKVTGGAKYAAEYAAPGLLHGYVVSGAIAKGRITAIDISKAMAVPGVVDVLTHEHRARTAWLSYNYKDMIGPRLASRSARSTTMGSNTVASRSRWSSRRRSRRHEPARPWSRRPTRSEEHITDLEAVKGQSYVPPKRRSGIAPPPSPRGKADAAFDAAPVKIERQYRVAVEHHNPMEPFSTTVVREDDGSLTIYDKTQGSQSNQAYVCGVFGLNKSKVKDRQRLSWAGASVPDCGRPISFTSPCWHLKHWSAPSACR